MTNKCSICNVDSLVTELIYNKPGLFSGKESFFICNECSSYISREYEKPPYYDEGEKPPYFEESINTEDFEFLNSIKNEVSKLMNELKPCENCGIENKLTKKITCEDCGFKYCTDCEEEDCWYPCPNCNEKKHFNPIVKLLKDKSTKMTITDIAAFIDQPRNEIKGALRYMSEKKMINYAGNGRYFILSDEKKKPKKATTKKADPTVELRKYAKLKDDGIITEEEFQAKKKELLGL